uniref:Uncharacterized protein n=1 Tax=Salix viminalis TaxID=40686 RepID=A0A6N2KSJ6_SALVM
MTLKVFVYKDIKSPSAYAKNIVYKDIISVVPKGVALYNFYTSFNRRVCRVWIPKLNGQTSSFNCLLVDDKGNANQASTKGKNIKSFAASIIEGDYYQISGFYTFEHRLCSFCMPPYDVSRSLSSLEKNDTL